YAEPKAAAKKFKIGVLKGATKRAQPEVKKNFNTALQVLSRFAEVVEGVAFPDLPYGSVVGTVLDAEAASAFRDLIESGRLGDMLLPANRTDGYAASLVLAVDYLQAMRMRAVMKRTLDTLYARYDALVAPSRATVAYPVDTEFHKAYPRFGESVPLIPAGNVA